MGWYCNYIILLLHSNVWKVTFSYYGQYECSNSVQSVFVSVGMDEQFSNLLQHLFNWLFNHAGYSCCTTQLVRPCTLCIAQPQKIWFYCTIGIIWEQMSSSASVSASLRLIFKPQSCSAQFVMVLIGSVCNHLHLCDWFFNWEQTALNKYLHCLAGRVA